MKEKRIFSGNDSKELWKRINRIGKKKPKLGSLLYLLGCKCQELESEVERLKAQISSK